MISLANTGLIDSGRLENGQGFSPLKKDLSTIENSLQNKRVFSFYERMIR